MPLKATKDTYGFENVGGVEVRRLIKAGDVVPSTYTVDDSSAVEEVGGTGSDQIKPTKAQKAAAESAKSEPTAEDMPADPADSEPAGAPDAPDPAEAGAAAGTSTTKKSDRKK